MPASPIKVCIEDIELVGTKIAWPLKWVHCYEMFLFIFRKTKGDPFVLYCYSTVGVYQTSVLV